MRRFWIACLTIAALSRPGWAQKIKTERLDPSRIVHVETALNHLTVIEVGEPVLTVAAGSSAFKIEWRENKVFIQPAEANVATNLFIWTKSGRLSYELEPAGSVAQMDFAIDQPAPRAVPVRTAAVTHPSPATTLAVDTDAMLGGRPVRSEESKEPKRRVIVLVKDVFRRDNEVFIRYEVQNTSKQGYEVSTPQVFVLDVPGSAQGFHRLANCQLSKEEAANLKTARQSPVRVLDGKIRAARVEPGQETVGFVGVKLPPASGATILRFVFGQDGKGQLTVTLVL